jgi:predicted acylesterase/phospholipase RssA
MLTIQRAKNRQTQISQPKIGLAIAGGGPLGAIYELGALHALNESVEGLHLHRLAVYVGVSAGGFVAASLANGLSTAQLVRIFTGGADSEFSFKPEDFLRPAYREYLDRAAALPAILSEALLEYARHPIRTGVTETMGRLSRAIPVGLFSNKRILNFLERSFSSDGRSDDFRKLPGKLFIVAVDLDNGTAVRFGSPGYDHVPISTAVQASAALPGLYPPVRIDGHYYVDGALRRTMHASAVLEEGVDLLLGINPLVPFESEPDDDLTARHKDWVANLVDGGLPMVLSQTFRAMIQSRIKVSLDKYSDRYENVDLLLIEPDRGDEDLFFANVFSYSSRRRLVEHAYAAARAQIRARAEELEQLLAPYGLRLRHELLADANHKFADSLTEKGVYHAPAARQLERTLSELDEILESYQ